MIRMLTGIVYLLSVLGILANCEQSSGSRKPVTLIQIQAPSKNFHIGDKVTVLLKTKLKNGSLSKSQLYLDQKEIFSTKNAESNFVIDTKDLNPGNHQLKVIAAKEDGQTGENYAELLVLSDIKPKRFTYKIVNSYPHNTGHFTQGLEIRNAYLYEGTGREGFSAIYKKNLATGKTIRENKLDDQYFGEGITILNGKLYELTYKSKIGFVYDLENFSLLKSFTFKSQEGWGMTNDGTSLIMSDGTEFLTYLDPATFNIIRKIEVCSDERVIRNLNELEFIRGEIWANIWMTDKIVCIDPKTGKITAEIDLAGLLGSSLSAQNSDEDVLNGIAFDADKNKIFVTGKLWPKLFEIELVPQ